MAAGKNNIYFIVYLFLLVGLIAHFVIIETTKDRRLNTILTQPDARQTTAVLTGVEERRLHNSSHLYAIIQYNTNTKSVKQAIKEDAGWYKQGQRINVIYSPEYPDMLRVKTSSAGIYDYP